MSSKEGNVIQVSSRQKAEHSRKEKKHKSESGPAELKKGMLGRSKRKSILKEGYRPASAQQLAVRKGIKKRRRRVETSKMRCGTSRVYIGGPGQVVGRPTFWGVSPRGIMGWVGFEAKRPPGERVMD
jgi:hypothetical protein